MPFDWGKAKELITKYEGGRIPKAYPDPLNQTIPTIGIGFNLSRPDAQAKIEQLGLNYDDVRNGRVALTDQQIDTLYDSSISEAVQHAQRVIPAFDSLDPARQFVIADMIYNMGAPRFDGFKETINAINAGDWNRASDEMQDSKWYDQVSNRSIPDTEMMKSGTWGGSGGA